MSDNKTVNKKQNNIYLFSTICALLIVLRHSSNLHKVGPYIVEMSIDDNLMGKVCVALQAFVHGGLSNIALYGFFVLSGYLFFRNYTYAKTLEKYKQRFRTLVIPYLLWHTIAYLFMVILTNLPFLAGRINTEPYSMKIVDFIYSIFFPDDIYWYLNYLIVFIAFAPLLYFFIKSKIVGIVRW